jgi:hypothetical protein
MTPTRLVPLVATAFLAALAGCQQKMAEMPSPRPFEQTDIFEFRQSARPLEPGVVHRNQAVHGDPLVTWLTAAGQNPQVSAEWKAAVDPAGKTGPTAGAPTDVANFVNEFPFEITDGDLTRGQTMFNAVCAECHGGAGYGNGKIVERGYLKPPSYHTDPTGKQRDSGHLVGDEIKDLPVGYSRGFDRYGKKVAIKDVPVGYIFQVITWGYGGMGSHAGQLPDPADRWRVISYIRALQLSQDVKVADLPAANKADLQKAGAK